jgi:AmmeMemoRadiSam system protein B
MDSKKKLIREATHAGSWYESDPGVLGTNIKNWLNNTKSNKGEGKLLKAIIGPHAGFYYSGATAAYAYSKINPKKYERVFLLGPCHHKYIKGCGLPSCGVYETPFGNINVDKNIIDDLAKLKNFEYVTKSDEEDEHSLEMHLPFIKHVFGDNNFSLIPIMVGSLNNKLEQHFGQIFSDYIKDDKNLFIVSSDFCHWGKGFDYTPYDKSAGEIWQSIEKLDKTGIELIEAQEADDFDKYLNQTENTICGRHPISVLLYALKYSKLETKTELLYYTQSSQVKNAKQSSVSYAAISSEML